ncbi:hypothetical protein MKW92_041262 [Papaver armeniacum]|nr:hypothetical protein MKW92_041262 [Papaver armeniacum]
MQALELDGRYLCNRDVGVGPLVESTTTGASKTLVAKNPSSSTTKSDVIEFFKQSGEIVDVRLSLLENGDFRGTCHIEFATEEGAKKAVELDGQYLLGHPVVLGFARETIFIRGFDTSLGFDQVQSSLEELFSTCGEILYMHIPTLGFDDNFLEEKSFIEFFDCRGFPKALAMNGHKLGDFTLTVEDAMPVQFNVKPTGGRKRFRGRPVGPYGAVYPNRYIPVMVVLALEKMEASTIILQVRKKTKFD